MRQIINVQIGRCGNQIGSRFWQSITSEHGIDKTGTYCGQSDLQLQNTNVYFSETTDGKYNPRAILTDLQPGTIDTIKGRPIGHLFKYQNFICARNGAANNFAKGFYTEGAQLVDSVTDMVRKQAQECDLLQGFQISHSLGGGTGSGFSSLLIDKLREQYQDKIIAAFSVFPSEKVSDTVVQPYNTVLSTSHLIQKTDQCIVFDNQALYDICFKNLKISHPTYGDLNHLTVSAMAGVTCSLRFPGQLNTDLRKLSVNLVPFPRAHFFMIGIAPLATEQLQKYKVPSVAELTYQMLNPKNMMCSANFKHGIFFAASVIFRGKFSSKQIQYHMLKVQKKAKSNFVQWIPNNIHSSICNIPSKGLDLSATFIGNSTAIKQTFEKTDAKFILMFRRKAFLHWYTSQGMDLLQFTQSQLNITDLIGQYQQYSERMTDQSPQEQYQ